MGVPKRVAAGLLAGALSVFGIALAAPAGATADVTADRLAGATRYGTAAAIAGDATFNGAKTVILATGQNFPDALAASAHAGKNAPAPIILTTTAALSDEASAALDKIKPTNVTVVGGTAAVSEGVVTSVKNKGITVTRVAGTDRYATAAEIAKTVGTLPSYKGQPTAIIATGLNFPDALTGGPLAYASGMPILLTNEGVPAATKSALQSIGAKQVIILGGTAAVSPAVETELEGIVGNDAIRVAGTDRFGTATAIADLEKTDFGFPVTTAILAFGMNFPDALAAGPLGGQLKAPIVLSASLPETTRKWLDDNSATIQRIIVVGGTAVIDQATVDAAVAAAESVGNDTVAGTSVTTLPELVSAKIAKVVSAAQATPASPEGVYIEYVFDTPILQSSIDEFSFYAYPADTNNDQTADDFVSLSADGLTVTVRFDFDAPLTATNANELVVATVDQAAVTDTDGDENTYGDAPIGTSGSASNTAGTSAAPDLTAVSGLRQGTDPNSTAVDFTFDQTAVSAIPAGNFHLVTVDNQDVDCDGPAVGSPAPSGGTVPGGDQTSKFTVLCDTTGLSINGTPVTGPLTSAQVARGWVDSGAVTSTAVTGSLPNPLEAEPESPTTGTTGPDLVSATLQLNLSGQDGILYTFDQAVDANAGLAPSPPFPAGSQSGADFKAYLANGDELTGLIVGAQSSDQRQILVIFGGAGTLDTAVGASAVSGAVANAASEDNEADEAAVTNSNPVTRTPGVTNAPDLTGVLLTKGGPFNQFIAAFVFDEEVTEASIAAGVTDGDFLLYLNDGTELVATSCTRAPSPNTKIVACSAFTNNATATPATSAQIGNAVLGALGYDAVEDAAGHPSVESAAATAGGTGSPAK